MTLYIIIGRERLNFETSLPLLAILSCDVGDSVRRDALHKLQLVHCERLHDV